MSLSPQLGGRHVVRLPQGEIRYRELGEGKALVFAHEFVTNGDVWRKVAPLLAERYRCIVPDWPYGPHGTPLDCRADLSVVGLVKLMGDFVRELDLTDVTLVGSGGGGTLCEVLAAEQPDRVPRLVVNTGDALWRFPAPRLRPYQALAFLPPVGYLFVQACRSPWLIRRIFRQAAHSSIDPEVLGSYPALLRRRAVRREMARAVRGLRTKQSIKAIPKLARYPGRALIVWTRQQSIFPIANGFLLAGLIPNSQFEELPNCGILVGEDQPERFASLVQNFIEDEGHGRSPSPAPNAAKEAT